MKPNDTALRKRTQISKANRVMFIWIAIASMLVSFSIVTAVFLGQRLVFNEKVLAEKNKTVGTLDANNKAITGLQENIRAIDADSDLAKAKASDSDKSIQVILDALPSDANSLALGASLQNKLLAGIQGLTLVSLQVDPVAGVESFAADGVEDASAAEASTDTQITFTFSVSGSQDALYVALNKLERSIRTITITNLRIENQSGSPLMTVQGKAFYEPAKNVALYEKAVRP